MRDPLGRALEVLRWMAEQPAPYCGVREAAKALDMQPSTVSRILAVMHEQRLVRRDPDSGGYAPGLELIRLGLLSSTKLDIRRSARPHLEAIVRACNESVFLALYDSARQEMLRVDTVTSSHPLRYVVEMDRWTEIYRGASGLGIAAFLPPTEREEVLATAEAHAGPEEPWLRRDQLRPMLDQIRARGYACTHGRRIPGAVGMAAPIFDAGGRVVGDVILTVPEVRFGEHEESVLAEHVIKAASAITAEIGGRPAPGDE